MTNLGVGVGRLGDMVVFVPGGCTGDLAEVKLIKVAKSYLVARLEKLIEPSPHRTELDCPVAKQCGGCVYRGITYEHELELKRSYVISAFKKAGLAPRVLPVLHAGIDGYRNKAQYPVVRGADGSIVTGFFAERTHEVVPIADNCRIQPDIFGHICAFLRDYMTERGIEPYDERTRGGCVRHQYLRRSEENGEVMVCVVVTRRTEWADDFAERLRRSLPEVASVWENINPDVTNVVLGKEYRLISGREKLLDRICGHEFEFSPASFWQVNRPAAELLYTKAGELAAIKPGESLLDLFCGIGTIGMSIAPVGARLYGVEIVPSAVENARANAERNGFKNASYSCLDASDPDAMKHELERLSRNGLDAVVLDPPRSGCSPELLRLLAELTSARIVYISCNPDTLARDAALLTSLGYRFDEVQPVDLFPRTGHCECAVLLSRIKEMQ